MFQSGINYKTLVVQLLWEIAGSILVAAAIYNFAAQAKFPMTGFSGIALIIYQMTGIPIGLSTILLNIPVGLLSYHLLGKKFFISSIRCMLIASVFVDYVAPLFPVYQGSRLLAALCTGVIGGIGYAIIYMQNTSTGGADFIIMAAKALKPYLSLGKIAFLTDVGIILIGGIILRDMDGIIYGMIVNYLFAIVVDKMMYGINAGKLAVIVTSHGKKVISVIDKSCGRGSTLISARGGFKGDVREVVLCACNNKEMYLVQRAVKNVDPEAFLIVLESNEVHGEGFKRIQIGEN
ncbi:MAG: YitT family protein [Lachnospiraceae bacterium]|nr:YitT family protein [Lachnospiraceae bacterium]